VRLILDAGALIGLDRNDRRVTGLIKLARRSGATLVSTPPAVAQAWRSGSRQALLARALPSIEMLPMTLADAKAVGELLALSRTSDVVDAQVALLALTGDQVVTSDVDDLKHLLGCRPVAATVVGV
jgi:hypothetical protein